MERSLIQWICVRPEHRKKRPVDPSSPFNVHEEGGWSYCPAGELEEDHRGGMVLRQRERRRAMRNGRDGVFVGERVAKHVAELVVIVDDEDARALGPAGARWLAQASISLPTRSRSPRGSSNADVRLAAGLTVVDESRSLARVLFLCGGRSCVRMSVLTVSVR